MLNVWTEVVYLPLSCFDWNGTLWFTEVSFIPYHHERKTIRLYNLRFVKERVLPNLHVIERLLVGDVIYQEAAVGSSVKSRAERLEAFLTSGVPNLHHDYFTIYCDLFIRKVSSHRRFEILCKFWVLELLNETGLAHSWVANGHDFDETLLFTSFDGWWGADHISLHYFININ